jgi:hypothetical protein
MRRLLIGLVAALALAVVPLGAAETSYSDPAGDSGTAPDITAVTVSNADDGTIAFRIAAKLVPDSGLVTFIEQDLSEDTDPYAVMVLCQEDGSVVAGMFDPNMTMISGMPTMVSSAAGVVQFQFPKSALAIDELFGFLIGSVNGASEETGFDFAPDDGSMWTYVLTKPAPPVVVKPVIGKPTVSPAAPVAGKRFTVSFPITRSDDGAPLTSATIGCTTKVAGKVVPHTHTFANGTIRATLVVPKAAKGKQLKVVVKVTAENQAATKVFTFKVE